MSSIGDGSQARGLGATDVFRRVLAAMPVGLLMLDDRNTIHYANGAAASALGGRTDQLIGSTFDAKGANDTILEVRDVETGRLSVARQTVATLPGYPPTRIVILTDETDSRALQEMRARARETAETMLRLESAAEAAAAELRGIPGSESAAVGLQDAVRTCAALIRELLAAEADKESWQERRGAGQRGVRQGDSEPVVDGAARRRRMLVVDDDGAVARITARALAVLGIEAIARDTVPGALAFLEAESVDAVLVDAMMPGPGVEQVCRELRELQPDAWIVVMSGADTVADRVRDVSDSFLAKPFSVAELRGLFEVKPDKALRRAA